MDAHDMEKYLSAIVLDKDKHVCLCVETLKKQGITQVPIDIYRLIQSWMRVPVYNTTRAKLELITHLTDEVIELKPGYDVMVCEFHVYHDTLTVQLEIDKIGDGESDHQKVVRNIELESLVQRLTMLGYLCVVAPQISINMVNRDFSFYNYGQFSLFHTAESVSAVPEEQRLEYTAALALLRQTVLTRDDKGRVDWKLVSKVGQQACEIHSRVFAQL